MRAAVLGLLLCAAAAAATATGEDGSPPVALSLGCAPTRFLHQQLTPALPQQMAPSRQGCLWPSCPPS